MKQSSTRSPISSTFNPLNPFRVRAYRNAARTIGELGTDIHTLLKRGTALTEIPGIGEDLAGKIQEILDTGKCSFLERLHQDMPPAVTELLKPSGLGPKRVKTLWHDLDIHTMDQLLPASQGGRIRELHGFGERTEQHILDAVQRHLGQAHRFKLAVAAQHAQAYVNYLRAVRGVKRAEVAGSVRRMKDTVGDLDIVVTAVKTSRVMERFTRHEDVKEVMASGPTRATVILKSGIQVDFRVVPEESYGAALVYFTGSKAHNIAIRRIPQERRLKINEYGVFKGAKSIAGQTEESVYAAIGLPWIPPELREDRGEVEAARQAALPHLIELADLHVYSKASDGHNSRHLLPSRQSRGGAVRHRLGRAFHLRIPRLALQSGVRRARMGGEGQRDKCAWSGRAARLAAAKAAGATGTGSLVSVQCTRSSSSALDITDACERFASHG
ncbi:MAG: helix-hairpin-helix domain-containing protein [Betaproteobacteria bacterium]